MPRIIKLEDIGKDGAPPWSIDGIISGLTLLWSDPGVGKSFTAISMAASVASGRPWLGHHTNQGQVVYIAGEGGLTNVGYRIRSALSEWGIESRDDYIRESVDFSVITPGIDLVNHPQELRTLIQDRWNLRLLVVDTLSRCLAGDENKQEVMGQFVRTLDDIRDDYGCDILVIHHANKQNALRGSSVLFGAADVSWKLTTIPGIDATHKMKADKLRERDAADSEIRLAMVSKGLCDWDGNPILNELGAVQTTRIVKPPQAVINMVSEIAALGREALKWGSLNYEAWRYASHTDDATFNAALGYILSYPGKWGIVLKGRGEYGRADEVSG